MLILALNPTALHLMANHGFLLSHIHSAHLTMVREAAEKSLAKTWQEKKKLNRLTGFIALLFQQR